MPKIKKQPAYQIHKATGQAKVRIDGRDHYLGPHGSDESHARYDDLIADWELRQQDTANLTIGELALLYVDHARQHYRKHGVETGGC